MTCEGTIHLRRAIADDAAGIAEVHAKGWKRAHDGLVPDAYLACVDTRVRENSWREELSVEAPDRKPWIALVDDRLVGFASVGISRDDDVGSETGEVYLVYVDPDCWGRGIGQTLLSHALRDLHTHGFEAATFWVVGQNEASRRFAEKHGWKADGNKRSEECGGALVEQLRYRHVLP